MLSTQCRHCFSHDAAAVKNQSNLSVAAEVPAHLRSVVDEGCVKVHPVEAESGIPIDAAELSDDADGCHEGPENDIIEDTLHDA